MARKKKKKLEDVCFPVPANLSLSSPTEIDSNEKLKNHLFQQTLQVAYGISIPYSFTTSFDPEKPYQLATDEEIAMVESLSQALQPKDAIEAALAQQFIIVHLQAVRSAMGGMGDRDIKKFELSHQILESFQKYRSKGAQQINVQYNHNEGQVNNIHVSKQEEEPTTIEVTPDE